MYSATGKCSGYRSFKTGSSDRTEIFTRLYFTPKIRVAAGGESVATVEGRVRRALQSAQKYSLVANSVKSEIVVEPEIQIEE